MQQATTPAKDWDLNQVPFSDIDLTAIKEQEDLFYMVTAASFVEIAADLYTDNLIRYFNDNADVVHWLENSWKPEEVRHGHVLRDYVRHVWPEFDWDRAYAEFFADYSRICTVDAFEPSRSLEMVARCVVETGTSTFYQSLAAQTSEPVLTGIANRIRTDEINHYKHFYRYFRMYHAIEPPGRLRILGALKRRILEARNSDAECALWHVYSVRETAAGPDKVKFRALCNRLSKRVQRHYPVTMAAKMLLRPLDLPAVVARAIQGPVARATAWLLR